MRFAPLLLLASVSLVGCSLNNNGSECNTDAQCGDDVCARSGECMPRSSVHSVMVSWTVDSAAASGSTACTQHPDLFLQFDGADYGDALRFAPVPCSEGVFSVDKLPTRYQSVIIGVEGASHGQSDGAALDATVAMAHATLNLVDLDSKPAADTTTDPSAD